MIYGESILSSPHHMGSLENSSDNELFIVNRDVKNIQRRNLQDSFADSDANRSHNSFAMQ